MLRLKELRQARNISQSKFAKDMGVAQNTVSNWENGNRLIDADTISAISDYFGVTADYLLGKTNNIEKTPAEADVTFDDFTYAMHSESKELTEENKNMLLDMARMLKKRQQEGK